MTQSVRASSNTKNFATCNKQRFGGEVTLFSGNKSGTSGADQGPLPSTQHNQKSGLVTDPYTQLLSTQGNRPYFISSGNEDQQLGAKTNKLLEESNSISSSDVKKIVSAYSPQAEIGDQNQQMIMT